MIVRDTVSTERTSSKFFSAHDLALELAVLFYSSCNCQLSAQGALDGVGALNSPLPSSSDNEEFSWDSVQFQSPKKMHNEILDAHFFVEKGLYPFYCIILQNSIREAFVFLQS